MFNGKVYKFHQGYPTKTQEKAIAKNMRLRGWKIRIIKAKGSIHLIYKRGK